MGIDDLKARLERLLAEQGLGGSPRRGAGAFRDALVDLKVGLRDLEDALAKTERELAVECEDLATAIRRGQLAAGIGDQETVDLAQLYATRHQERVAVLERKLAVQRDELAIAERDYQDLAARYQAALQGRPMAAAAPPNATDDPDLVQGRLDARAAEAAVDAQLELLKKKLGKTQ